MIIIVSPCIQIIFIGSILISCMFFREIHHISLSNNYKSVNIVKTILMCCLQIGFFLVLTYIFYIYSCTVLKNIFPLNILGAVKSVIYKTAIFTSPEQLSKFSQFFICQSVFHNLALGFGCRISFRSAFHRSCRLRIPVQ